MGIIRRRGDRKPEFYHFLGEEEEKPHERDEEKKYFTADLLWIVGVSVVCIHLKTETRDRRQEINQGGKRRRSPVRTHLEKEEEIMARRRKD